MMFGLRAGSRERPEAWSIPAGTSRTARQAQKSRMGETSEHRRQRLAGRPARREEERAGSLAGGGVAEDEDAGDLRQVLGEHVDVGVLVLAALRAWRLDGSALLADQ